MRNIYIRKTFVYDSKNNLIERIDHLGNNNLFAYDADGHLLSETDAEEKIQRELDVSKMDMSFISSDDDDMKWITDFADGKIEVGLTTGDPRMDKHFRFKKDFASAFEMILNKNNKYPYILLIIDHFSKFG